MVATSIQFQAADDGAPSPFVPLDGTMVYEAQPDGKVDEYRWEVTGGLEIVEGGTSSRVTVRGARVDAQLGGSTLSVTIDGGRFTAILPLTVVSLDRLVAEVPSTPRSRSNTARAALQLLDPPPMEHGSDQVRPELRRESSLLLVSGSVPAITVRAEVRPSGVPIAWSSVRAPEDEAGSDGLKLSTTTGSTTQATTTAVGAYFVSAQVAVREGIELRPAMHKTLPVVLVGVTKVTDATRYANAFRPQTELEFLRFSSNGFARDEQQSRTFIYASGENFIEYDAEIELVSGGRDGRLFLDDVRAAWIQTARGTSRGGSDELRGVYQSGATTAAGLVGSWFLRGRTYVFDEPVIDPIAYPVPDAQDGDVPPVVARHESQLRPDLAKGEVRRLLGEDLPNATLPAYFAGGDDDGDPLTSVTLDSRFSAYVCLWTRSAPRVFGVAHRIDWGLEGAWAIQSVSPLQVTVTQTPQVVHQATVISPVQPADQAGAEILGPGNVDHLVVVQTKAK